ncbi:hypothetical protein Hanom_Chr06g00542131 [Helianthus anomalus]
MKLLNSKRDKLESCFCSFTNLSHSKGKASTNFKILSSFECHTLCFSNLMISS